MIWLRRGAAVFVVLWGALIIVAGVPSRPLRASVWGATFLGLSTLIVQKPALASLAGSGICALMLIEMYVQGAPRIAVMLWALLVLLIASLEIGRLRERRVSESISSRLNKPASVS